MNLQPTHTLLFHLLGLQPAFLRSFTYPIENALSEDLTPTQNRALFTLTNCGELTMGTLASELGISKQQLTKVAATLVKKGYIVRNSDSKNRRLVLVSPSEKGNAYVQSTRADIATLLCPVLETLSEEEQKQLDHHALNLRALLEKLPRIYA